MYRRLRVILMQCSDRGEGAQMIKFYSIPINGVEKLYMHFGPEICTSSWRCKVPMFQNKNKSAYLAPLR